jgi:endonuclease YncB( thermonuclease family)
MMVRAVALGAVIIAIVLAAGVVSGEALGAERIRGPVAATVKRVVDGDTIKVTAAPWPSLRTSVTIRVDGVDTPELRSRCAKEATGAKQARDFVIARLDATGGAVTLHDIRPGKYASRMVARVMINDHNLATLLIKAGLGREYHGGWRQGWC